MTKVDAKAIIVGLFVGMVIVVLAIYKNAPVPTVVGPVVQLPEPFDQWTPPPTVLTPTQVFNRGY